MDFYTSLVSYSYITLSNLLLIKMKIGDMIRKRDYFNIFAGRNFFRVFR